MKKRNKIEKCFNCTAPLDHSYNFCPNCGQENNDRQLSFGKLLNDFFSNYFSLDSRFGRSIKPFFFQPGFLTKQFMDGKRVTYANPIRLYLVVSLIHFFTLSLYTNISATNDHRAIIDIATENDDVAVVDSINRDADIRKVSLLLPDVDWNTIKEMAAADHSTREISDSLNLADKPYWQRHVVLQAIKIMKSDEASIRGYILENIPILMFLLLPVYALLLKFFFRKKLYINHLVHSLHIHSFVFIVLTFYWIVALSSAGIPGQVNILLFFLLTFYIVVSFKNTYHITSWGAVYKVLLSGLIYCVMMLMALLIEMLISLLTY